GSLLHRKSRRVLAAGRDRRDGPRRRSVAMGDLRRSRVWLLGHRDRGNARRRILARRGGARAGGTAGGHSGGALMSSLKARVRELSRDARNVSDRADCFYDEACEIENAATELAQLVREIEELEESELENPLNDLVEAAQSLVDRSDPKLWEGFDHLLVQPFMDALRDAKEAVLKRRFRQEDEEAEEVEERMG